MAWLYCIYLEVRKLYKLPYMVNEQLHTIKKYITLVWFPDNGPLQTETWNIQCNIVI